ncbi:MAG: hypothetical protein ACJ8C4_14740 [Gemmataceae bacterium]
MDFSGAVGGPFEVTATAEPTKTKVSEPITFKVRITGAGDLSAVKTLNLEDDPEFIKRFTIEVRGSTLLHEPKGQEFEFVLRAREAEIVNVIPRIKLVYFNPSIRPMSRGFQTTFSQAISLDIDDPPPEIHPEVPQQVLTWIEKNSLTYNDILALRDKPDSWFDWICTLIHISDSKTNDVMPVWIIVLAAVTPPLCSAVWYRIERRKQQMLKEQHYLMISMNDGSLRKERDWRPKQ